MDGGGWISLFSQLPPAEMELFLLLTGVDVDGRGGTRCLAGAVVIGAGAGGAGTGRGAFLTGNRNGRASFDFFRFFKVDRQNLC